MAPFQGLGFASSAGATASAALAQPVHRVPPAQGRACGRTARARGSGPTTARPQPTPARPTADPLAVAPTVCAPTSLGVAQALPGGRDWGRQQGRGSTRARAGDRGRRAPGGSLRAHGLPSAASGPCARAHAGAWHGARHGISAPLTASCRERHGEECAVRRPRVQAVGWHRAAAPRPTRAPAATSRRARAERGPGAGTRWQPQPGPVARPPHVPGSALPAPLRPSGTPQGSALPTAAGWGRGGPAPPGAGSAQSCPSRTPSSAPASAAPRTGTHGAAWSGRGRRVLPCCTPSAHPGVSAAGPRGASPRPGCHRDRGVTPAPRRVREHGPNRPTGIAGSERRRHRGRFPWQRERLLNRRVAMATATERGCLGARGGPGGASLRGCPAAAPGPPAPPGPARPRAAAPRPARRGRPRAQRHGEGPGPVSDPGVPPHGRPRREGPGPGPGSPRPAARG